MSALASKEDVRQIVFNIRLLLSHEDNLVFVDREKNRQAITQLELLPSEIPGILRSLRVEDYSAGPLDDDAGREEKWWVFGPNLNGTPLYIKVSLSHDRLLCLSFHLAEPALPHPLRKEGGRQN